MKRVWLPLALVALGVALASPPARAQSCSIGGHNETRENFATGGWAIVNMSPHTVEGAPAGTHLVISEVAPPASVTYGPDYVHLETTTTSASPGKHSLKLLST